MPGPLGARPLFERALASLEKALGSEHTNTNRTRYNLSSLLLHVAQPTDALALGQSPSPHPIKFSDATTRGPKLAPAS
jgi:hypothetical protein